eukprot:gene28301-34173_t
MISHALLLICLVYTLQTALAGTSISVYSEYKKEVNIKIQGTGIGGCDIILQPGQNNVNDCWCLWGTINYSFCAYTKNGLADEKAASNTSSSDPLKNGKCPVVTGESLVCSDLSSLGNCYDGAYSCKVDNTGLCHCQTV